MRMENNFLVPCKVDYGAQISHISVKHQLKHDNPIKV